MVDEEYEREHGFYGCTLGLAVGSPVRDEIEIQFHPPVTRELLIH